MERSTRSAHHPELEEERKQQRRLQGSGGSVERDDPSGPVGRCRKRPLAFPSSVTAAAASLAPVAAASFWRKEKRKRFDAPVGAFHLSPLRSAGAHEVESNLSEPLFLVRALTPSIAVTWPCDHSDGLLVCDGATRDACPNRDALLLGDDVHPALSADGLMSAFMSYGMFRLHDEEWTSFVSQDQHSCICVLIKLVCAVSETASLCDPGTGAGARVENELIRGRSIRTAGSVMLRSGNTPDLKDRSAVISKSKEDLHTASSLQNFLVGGREERKLSGKVLGNRACPLRGQVQGETCLPLSRLEAGRKLISWSELMTPYRPRRRTLPPVPPQAAIPSAKADGVFPVAGNTSDTDCLWLRATWLKGNL
ncbi:hypothetical protein EYF80_034359 [Liparis tanakae]|uniref:Uncharacterized protein n=1 Tax=Liparis tanakae TaxID=230148 RepID=A0A4Z2GPY0_9TELE|nr:hypothetical protein EYF80_034359 [Liparis tanakae]